MANSVRIGIAGMAGALTLLTAAPAFAAVDVTVLLDPATVDGSSPATVQGTVTLGKSGNDSFQPFRANIISSIDGQLSNRILLTTFPAGFGCSQDSGGFNCVPPPAGIDDGTYEIRFTLEVPAGTVPSTQTVQVSGGYTASGILTIAAPGASSPAASSPAASSPAASSPAASSPAASSPPLNPPATSPVPADSSSPGDTQEPADKATEVPTAIPAGEGPGGGGGFPAGGLLLAGAGLAAVGAWVKRPRGRHQA